MTERTASPEDRLYRIAEEGLCIGCGLCQSIAGGDKVEVAMTPTGYERPVVRAPLDHDTVDRIYAACPGTRVEGLPESLCDVGTLHDDVWGAYRNMVMSHAADRNIRHASSTGGVLSALCLYLLDAKRVDFILHVKASTAYPACGEPHLSFDGVQVMEGAGSRYGPAAPLRDIADVLAREQHFAFVGKPCDISALRCYARQDARVDALCRYMLTPVCGGFMVPENMRRFLGELGIDQEDITKLRYRGFGCPGPTRIETRQGQVVEKNYLDFWGEDESSWSLPFRCKVCPDGIGEAADVAAADSWPGGSPTWEGQIGDEGTNAIVVRTAAGSELVEAAANAGYLTTGDDVSPREMDGFQPHQVTKKRTVWARHAGLRAAGRLVPETERLRIRELALERGYAANADQARGTRARVRDGKTTEPRPVRLESP